MKKSIIVYTNNSEKYIGKQIQSILEQLNEAEEQLIIVDDLSNDNTIPIIVSTIGYMFMEEENYKLYINNEKKGRKESIKMAQTIATGKFKQVVNGKKKVRL